MPARFGNNREALKRRRVDSSVNASDIPFTSPAQALAHYTSDSMLTYPKSVQYSSASGGDISASVTLQGRFFEVIAPNEDIANQKLAVFVLRDVYHQDSEELYKYYLKNAGHDKPHVKPSSSLPRFGFDNEPRALEHGRAVAPVPIVNSNQVPVARYETNHVDPRRFVHDRMAPSRLDTYYGLGRPMGPITDQPSHRIPITEPTGYKLGTPRSSLGNYGGIALSLQTRSVPTRAYAPESTTLGPYPRNDVVLNEMERESRLAMEARALRMERVSALSRVELQQPVFRGPVNNRVGLSPTSRTLATSGLGISTRKQAKNRRKRLSRPVAPAPVSKKRAAPQPLISRSDDTVAQVSNFLAVESEVMDARLVDVPTQDRFPAKFRLGIPCTDTSPTKSKSTQPDEEKATVSLGYQFEDTRMRDKVKRSLQLELAEIVSPLNVIKLQKENQELFEDVCTFTNSLCSVNDNLRSFQLWQDVAACEVALLNQETFEHNRDSLASNRILTSLEKRVGSVRKRVKYLTQEPSSVCGVPLYYVTASIINSTGFSQAELYYGKGETEISAKINACCAILDYLSRAAAIKGLLHPQGGIMNKQFVLSLGYNSVPAMSMVEGRSVFVKQCLSLKDFFCKVSVSTVNQEPKDRTFTSCSTNHDEADLELRCKVLREMSGKVPFWDYENQLLDSVPLKKRYID